MKLFVICVHFMKFEAVAGTNKANITDKMFWNEKKTRRDEKWTRWKESGHKSHYISFKCSAL